MKILNKFCSDLNVEFLKTPVGMVGILLFAAAPFIAVIPESLFHVQGLLFYQVMSVLSAGCGGLAVMFSLQSAKEPLIDLQAASDADLEYEYVRRLRKYNLAAFGAFVGGFTFVGLFGWSNIIHGLDRRWSFFWICMALQVCFVLFCAVGCYVAKWQKNLLGLLRKECGKRAVAKALPSVNRIVRGRLYKGEDAEVIKSEGVSQLDIDDNIVITQFCRTRVGGWFRLRFVVLPGLTDPCSCEITPLSQDDVYEQFERDPEQFTNLFGNPEVA